MFPTLVPYNLELKQYSRELRRNMTDAEKRIWSKVRLEQLKGCKFYRQKIIGNYIVDFFCPKAKLAIELDGGQHYSEDMIEEDKIRDAYLKNHGIKVLRFTDTDALTNTDGVIERILEYL
jgi:very-short-patch-repair endonuclease